LRGRCRPGFDTLDEHGALRRARGETAMNALDRLTALSRQNHPTLEHADSVLAEVIAVSGSWISATVRDGSDGAIPTAMTEGLQIGGLVRIDAPGARVFGLVNSLRIEEIISPLGKGERRLVEIQLIGEIVLPKHGASVRFQRGVSAYPGLGAHIYAATAAELRMVYARPDAASVAIGTIHQDCELPAYIMTDETLGKHFAVLGTTGSGKSCATALLLRAILSEHPCGHVVMIDPHNEYWSAFGDAAEVIRPDTLELPYWLLDFEETAAVMVSKGSDSAESEATILKWAIVEAKRKFTGPDELTDHYTVDTLVPYRIGDLVKLIDNAMGELDKPDSTVPYKRLMARIEALRADRRLDFMFGAPFVQDNMVEILARLMRIPTYGKPITLLDISGLPAEIVDVVVSLLCRTLFDFSVWTPRDQARPVLLVCEEAHRYAPENPEEGFAPTKRALARIAKEGRKYGIGLCLVSQRPSELSTAILSQCNTLFAMRMSNDRDYEFVKRAMPESAHGLLGALPALRTQEAIAVGEGVSVPMRMRFDDMDDAERPASGTARFAQKWLEETANEEMVAETIYRWRNQIR
jgi:DNA helicase HerA-like ATPase